MMTKNSAKVASYLSAGALALAASAAHAEWALNMTQGVTDISRRIYSLHMLMLWICVAIGVFVFGWIIYSILSFRKSQGAVPDTRMVHNTKAEVIWTVIPVLILIACAVPAARTLIETENATNTELTIRVTGYQWKWGYDYVDAGVNAGVLMAPIVPGFSSSRAKLERTVKAIADHGARFVGCNVMYLEDGTRTHFMSFLEREFPSMVPRYERLYVAKHPPRAYREEVQALVRMLQQRHGLASRHRESPSAPLEAPEDRREVVQVGFAW